jgi:hypothetical protein
MVSHAFSDSPSNELKFFFDVPISTCMYSIWRRNSMQAMKRCMLQESWRREQQSQQWKEVDATLEPPERPLLGKGGRENPAETTLVDHCSYGIVSVQSQLCL